MPFWELETDSVRQSFAAWGIANAQLTRQSLAADELTFQRDGDGVTDAPAFVRGQAAVIWRDSVRFFTGRFFGPADAATGSAESKSYRIVGPWSYFERLVFMQTRTMIGAGTVYHPRVNLFTALNGSLISANAQISEAVTYAIACGRPLALGTINLPVNPPAEEALDLSVAEVIRRCVRYRPDCVSWFDYSTEVPTFHLVTVASLATATVALSEERISGLQLRARELEQITAAKIFYETEDESRFTRAIDVYPAGATGQEDGALLATFSLQGPKISILRQKVVVGPIPENDGTWWIDHDKGLYALCHPAIGGYNVQNLTITGQARLYPAEDFPSEVLEGQIADWMTDDYQIEAREDTLTALATYEIYDSANRLLKKCKQPVTVSITVTNAISKTYETVASSEAGEPTPIGLAQAIYEALSAKFYEGVVTLTEQEAGGVQFMGKTLALTGIRPDFSERNWLICAITESLDAGTTTLQLGPPPYLNLGDMVSFLRNTRRRVVCKRAERTSGEVEGDGQLNLPNRGRMRDGNKAPAIKSLEVFPSNNINDDVTRLDAENGLLEVESTEV